MRFRLRHYTHYHYAEPVEQAHNQLRMLLRDVPGQHCLQRGLRIHPRPTSARMHRDFFGNRVLYTELERPHLDARIFVKHLVELDPAPLIAPAATPPWEVLVAALDAQRDADARALQLYRLASRMITLPDALAAFARPHFAPGRPVLEAALALSDAIHAEFRFDPEATSIATPVEEVLRNRHGVCQDFAHLMIAALRGLGLPARYVSGYLETLPPPGRPRLVGADASHAWVGLWCGPDHGWQDIDPTNAQRPQGQHIVAAWGRDYDDVIPLNGVISGGGDESSLLVRVDVERLDGDAQALPV